MLGLVVGRCRKDGRRGDDRGGSKEGSLFFFFCCFTLWAWGGRANEVVRWGGKRSDGGGREVMVGEEK